MEKLTRVEEYFTRSMQLVIDLNKSFAASFRWRIIQSEPWFQFLCGEPKWFVSTSYIWSHFHFCVGVDHKKCLMAKQNSKCWRWAVLTWFVRPLSNNRSSGNYSVAKTWTMTPNFHSPIFRRNHTNSHLFIVLPVHIPLNIPDTPVSMAFLHKQYQQ